MDFTEPVVPVTRFMTETAKRSAATSRRGGGVVLAGRPGPPPRSSHFQVAPALTLPENCSGVEVAGGRGGEHGLDAEGAGQGHGVAPVLGDVARGGGAAVAHDEVAVLVREDGADLGVLEVVGKALADADEPVQGVVAGGAHEGA